MVKKPQIFLTRANQHIKEINRHFDGTLNHYGFCIKPRTKVILHIYVHVVATRQVIFHSNHDHIGRDPSQDVTFFYTVSNLSELQSCTLLFLNQF